MSEAMFDTGAAMIFGGSGGVGQGVCREFAKAGTDVAIRQIEVKIKREVGLAYRASAPLADALKDFVGKLQRGRAKPRNQPGRRKQQ